MFAFLRVVMVTLSLYSKRNPMTDVDTWDWGIFVIVPTIVVFKGIWTLGVWIREAVGCFKCYFLNGPYWKEHVRQ